MKIELQDNLQAAEAGSDRLDHELLLHFGARHEKDWCHEYWFGEERCYDDRPTQSIDSALVLFGRVLPGWRENKRLMLECDPHRGPFWQVRLKRSGDDWPAHGTKHKSPAIALCLALLATDTGGGGDAKD
jgi:hypothetical protein